MAAVMHTFPARDTFCSSSSHSRLRNAPRRKPMPAVGRMATSQLQFNQATFIGSSRTRTLGTSCVSRLRKVSSHRHRVLSGGVNGNSGLLGGATPVAEFLRMLPVPVILGPRDARSQTQTIELLGGPKVSFHPHDRARAKRGKAGMGPRGLILVRRGKGDKDRSTLLAASRPEQTSRTPAMGLYPLPRPPACLGPLPATTLRLCCAGFSPMSRTSC
jgi:hypothetical protein